MSLTTEVVVYSIESALIAQQAGADRVELCDNPGEGGTTPSAGIIHTLQSLLSIPICVMIRPRGGDFYYSDHEFEAMKHDIRQYQDLEVGGFVFGILNKDGTIDKERCETLTRLAAPVPTICHRAFDMTRDPYAALQDCIDVGFSRILTSGQKATAPEGVTLIADLVKQAGDKISIMPGSGINEKTVSTILQQTSVNEIHFAAESHRASEMEYINSDILGMGSAEGQEYELQTTSAEQIKAIRSLAGQAAGVR